MPGRLLKKCLSNKTLGYKSLSFTKMSKEEIIKEVQKQFDGLVVDRNWGEMGLFYNPDGLLPKGVYLLTFKEKDGPNDRASNTNREGVFRLNIGITRDTFIRLFKRIPARPNAGEIIDMPFNFTQLNKIMPHPVYGWMSWIGVLNPDQATFKELLPLIEEGYNLALKKYDMKISTLKKNSLE
jgi:hypothetical protein